MSDQMNQTHSSTSFFMTKNNDQYRFKTVSFQTADTKPPAIRIRVKQDDTDRFIQTKHVAIQPSGFQLKYRIRTVFSQPYFGYRHSPWIENRKLEQEASVMNQYRIRAVSIWTDRKQWFTPWLYSNLVTNESQSIAYERLYDLLEQWIQGEQIEMALLETLLETFRFSNRDQQIKMLQTILSTESFYSKPVEWFQWMTTHPKYDRYVHEKRTFLNVLTAWACQDALDQLKAEEEQELWLKNDDQLTIIRSAFYQLSILSESIHLEEQAIQMSDKHRNRIQDGLYQILLKMIAEEKMYEIKEQSVLRIVHRFSDLIRTRVIEQFSNGIDIDFIDEQYGLSSADQKEIQIWLFEQEQAFLVEVLKDAILFSWTEQSPIAFYNGNPFDRFQSKRFESKKAIIDRHVTEYLQILDRIKAMLAIKYSLSIFSNQETYAVVLKEWHAFLNQQKEAHALSLLASDQLALQNHPYPMASNQEKMQPLFEESNAFQGKQQAADPVKLIAADELNFQQHLNSILRLSCLIYEWQQAVLFASFESSNDRIHLISEDLQQIDHQLYSQIQKLLIVLHDEKHAIDSFIHSHQAILTAEIGSQLNAYVHAFSWLHFYALCPVDWISIQHQPTSIKQLEGQWAKQLERIVMQWQETKNKDVYVASIKEWLQAPFDQLQLMHDRLIQLLPALFVESLSQSQKKNVPANENVDAYFQAISQLKAYMLSIKSKEYQVAASVEQQKLFALRREYHIHDTQLNELVEQWFTNFDRSIDFIYSIVSSPIETIDQSAKMLLLDQQWVKSFEELSNASKEMKYALSLIAFVADHVHLFGQMTHQEQLVDVISDEFNWWNPLIQNDFGYAFFKENRWFQTDETMNECLIAKSNELQNYHLQIKLINQLMLLIRNQNPLAFYDVKMIEKKQEPADHMPVAFVPPSFSVTPIGEMILGIHTIY